MGLPIKRLALALINNILLGWIGRIWRIRRDEKQKLMFVYAS